MPYQIKVSKGGWLLESLKADHCSVLLGHVGDGQWDLLVTLKDNRQVVVRAHVDSLTLEEEWPEGRYLHGAV